MPSIEYLEPAHYQMALDQADLEEATHLQIQLDLSAHPDDIHPYIEMRFTLLCQFYAQHRPYRAKASISYIDWIPPYSPLSAPLQHQHTQLEFYLTQAIQSLRARLEAKLECSLRDQAAFRADAQQIHQLAQQLWQEVSQA